MKGTEVDPVVIIGAGVGGLAAGAVLAESGIPVRILEAHIYPGGCAGTFFHQGYHFDAGATLTGGFDDDAPLGKFGKRFGIQWNGRPASLPLRVYLPGNQVVNRWADPKRWKEERIRVFENRAESFWAWQESRARSLWKLAEAIPPWPPQSPGDMLQLGKIGLPWLMSSSEPARVAADGFRTVDYYLRDQSQLLRDFVDGQLLISTQTTSEKANALFSAAALDLFNTGVVHLPEGVGSLAKNMAAAVERMGGDVIYRAQVTAVKQSNSGLQITYQRGKTMTASQVIYNLSPWAVRDLLRDQKNKSSKLHRLTAVPPAGWGAFVVYLGVPGGLIPVDFPLHHQIIRETPQQEGKSVFLSISPDWDPSRAPAEGRALTVSTHTHLEQWWSGSSQSQGAYQKLKEEFLELALTAVERILPGVQNKADLILPGTPVTFQRFTRRPFGWVGGFPQVNIFQNWGARLGPGSWMVGDTIFPGQSIPAAVLGGLRVGEDVKRNLLENKL